MNIFFGPQLLFLIAIFALAKGDIYPSLYCNIIDAAFTQGTTHYFAYNGKLVGFNFLEELVYTGRVTDTGVRGLVTAGVGLRHQGTFYLMTRKKEWSFIHFGETSNSHPFYDSGIGLDLAQNYYYFRFGIDAAFQKPDPYIVYFTGCMFLEVDGETSAIIRTGDNRDVGLPCYLDAAWSSPTRDEAYLVRGFEMWTWKIGEDRAEGPVHLFSRFCHLADSLCPPEESL